MFRVCGDLISNHLCQTANAFFCLKKQKISHTWWDIFEKLYYFTLSQIAVKACGSLTASSARTLRSSSIPLVFIPLINLL